MTKSTTPLILIAISFAPYGARARWRANLPTAYAMGYGLSPAARASTFLESRLILAPLPLRDGFSCSPATLCYHWDD